MDNMENILYYYIHILSTFTVCYCSHGPVEIGDLPSYKMVIFHSCLYVYQRVNHMGIHLTFTGHMSLLNESLGYIP
jgi:hypothetical protein